MISGTNHPALTGSTQPPAYSLLWFHVDRPGAGGSLFPREWWLLASGGWTGWMLLCHGTVPTSCLAHGWMGTPLPLYVASLDGPSMWAPKQDGRIPFLVTRVSPKRRAKTLLMLLMLRSPTGPASLLLLSADSAGSQVSPGVCWGHRWGPHKGTNTREA